MTAEAKLSRGTKRRCQNEACGSPFYDLNRATITCPICAEVFVPVVREPPPSPRGRPPRPFPSAAPPLAPAAMPDEEPALAEPAIAEPGGEALLEVDEEEGDGLSDEVEIEESPRDDE